MYKKRSTTKKSRLSTVQIVIFNRKIVHATWILREDFSQKGATALLTNENSIESFEENS